MAGLSAEDLHDFHEFFYRKTGIRLDGKRRGFTERRLVERFRETSAQTFREYFSIVQSQPADRELQALINLMTVNETYFFREDYQFDCLTRHLLDEVTAGREKGDSVRIWSAPCSTGEEPYSLAIWILENWPRADDFRIEIHGSDVDTRALDRARAGIYDARALHRVSDPLRQKYFAPAGPNLWQIREELRRSVDFSAVNLIEPARTNRTQRFDVIFCRNMLIYFDDQSRRVAADGFYRMLRPGGFICLGHSESMGRISPRFIPRRFPEALVHQKPRDGE